MDVREKLVELIKQSGACFSCFPVDEFENKEIEKIASHLIANGVTVQEWVKVEDRLPEKCGRYLTANRTKKGHVVNVYDLWFEDSKWYVDECDDLYEGEVTYWMNLPQPPKGD